MSVTIPRASLGKKSRKARECDTPHPKGSRVIPGNAGHTIGQDATSPDDPGAPGPKRREMVIKKGISKLEGKVLVELTQDELQLVLYGLASHRYRYLSDQVYRNSGLVMDPGSDDEDATEIIKQLNKLEAKLEKMRKT